MSENALTIETLNEAIEAVKKRGSELRHDCRYDGHVGHFCSTRCVHCQEVIRELYADEQAILRGEF